MAGYMDVLPFDYCADLGISQSRLNFLIESGIDLAKVIGRQLHWRFIDGFRPDSSWRRRFIVIQEYDRFFDRIPGCCPTSFGWPPRRPSSLTEPRAASF